MKTTTLQPTILKHLQLTKLLKTQNTQYTIFELIINKDPKCLNFFSSYEFSSKTYKINNIYSHRFHHDHLQHNIHGVNECKIPKILVLQSYTIPLEKK